MKERLFITPEYTTAKEIKKIRKELHLTQKEFAEKSGLYPNIVSNLCRNNGTSVNFTYMEKIAEVFDLKDVKEILELRE